MSEHETIPIRIFWTVQESVNGGSQRGIVERFHTTLGS